MDSNDPNVPPPYNAVPPTQAPSVTAGGLSENSAAALSYLTFIPAIIFLVTEPYNRSPFIRFHSMQSIALFVVWVVCFVIQTVIMVIPILGFLIAVLIGLTLFGTWIFTVVNAAQGKWFKLPLLGDFAMKQAKV